MDTSYRLRRDADEKRPDYLAEIALGVLQQISPMKTVDMPSEDLCEAKHGKKAWLGFSARRGYPRGQSEAPGHRLDAPPEKPKDEQRLKVTDGVDPAFSGRKNPATPYPARLFKISGDNYGNADGAPAGIEKIGGRPAN